MKKDNSDRCIRCWHNYQLDVRLRPISIKTWEEDGKEVTSRKFACTCGCSFERTTVKEMKEIQ